MKTDKNLRNMHEAILRLRVYDDDLSVMVRMRMIHELNIQNKTIVANNMMNNQTN